MHCRNKPGTLSLFYSYLFTSLYDYVMTPFERSLIAPLRLSLLSIAQGRVLEIGSGTGANLPFYDWTTRVVATEPKRGMLRQAQQRRRHATAQVALTGCHAEHLPLADGSFDTVVSTFVLCSVADQQQAIAELWRVLRPGGMVLLLEHIRAPHAGWQAVQRAWNPIQGVLGDGCSLTRETLQVMETNGFVLRYVQALGGGPFPLRMVRAERMPAD